MRASFYLSSFLSFFLVLAREKKRKGGRVASVQSICPRDFFKTRSKVLQQEKRIRPKSGSTTGYLNTAQSHCTQLPFVNDPSSSIVRLIKEMSVTKERKDGNRREEGHTKERREGLLVRA